jgi:tRNA-specific 2-thiouridylase
MEATKNKKVLVAMSGGVDSSVAAAELIQQGFIVEGVFMRLLPTNLNVEENIKGHLFDAQKIAKQLDMPLHIVDYSWDMQQVVAYFLEEYSRGRTPNPCVRCNMKLKFGRLLSFSRQMGADFLATGHYAKIIDYSGDSRLARANFREKDQSYVLFGIGRADLSSILFPNGLAQSKDAIRARAKEMNLPIHDKGDSQEICFVPDDDYVKFLSTFKPELNQPGPIRDREGRIIGEHQGFFRYTVGQRRGLRIAAGDPIYVTRIDPFSNTVHTGSRQDLACSRLTAVGLSWHIPKPNVGEEIFADTQIRYSHKAAPAKITILDLDRATVEFSTPQYAVTPGQAVVFYDGEMVIGGGWISQDDR